jgi:hypothetical protein
MENIISSIQKRAESLVKVTFHLQFDQNAVIYSFPVHFNSLLSVFKILSCNLKYKEMTEVRAYVNAIALLYQEIMKPHWTPNNIHIVQHYLSLLESRSVQLHNILTEHLRTYRDIHLRHFYFATPILKDNPINNDRGIQWFQEFVIYCGVKLNKPLPLKVSDLQKFCLANNEDEMVKSIVEMMGGPDYFVRGLQKWIVNNTDLILAYMQSSFLLL